MDPYDLASLFTHREILEGLDPNGTPSLSVFGGSDLWRSIAFLSGSFNPPTAAHHLLAERSLLAGFDAVLFVLARTTAGKAQSGLIPEDRLLALRAMRTGPETTVAVCSHSLYAELADAARAAYPNAEIAFLTGSDKVAQIFDGSWYDDRDSALERLFERGRLIVAPRASNGESVREILEHPNNRRFADRVEVLPLHPAVSDLSSTRVRGLLQSGAELCGLVPSKVADFLSEIGAFTPPKLTGDEEIDVYAIRVRLLEALWSAREWAERAADFRALHALATSSGPDGRSFRESLRRGGAIPEELERAQALAT
jgi:nicotinic acid mononucleotide adenylyltransferase